MPRVRVGEVCEVGCDEVKGGEVEGEELPCRVCSHLGPFLHEHRTIVVSPCCRMCRHIPPTTASSRTATFASRVTYNIMASRVT